MEQPHQLAAFVIPARDVRPLVTIAGWTGESQIRLFRSAAVLLGYNVIDLERERKNRLRKPAVFALLPCPVPDLPRKVAVH